MMNNYNITNDSFTNSGLIRTKDLPQIFRLISISHKKLAENLYLHTAKIFHDYHEITVAWINEESLTHLAVGNLVSPLWVGEYISSIGQVLINKLDHDIQPTEIVNLFNTVPAQWMPVSSIIKFAKTTFEDLPKEFKLLFNAIFWKGDRFYRYLVIPNSIDQQFKWQYGNIMHALVMAKKAKALAIGTSKDSLAVITLAALLDDAGMADDFAISNCGRKFETSKRSHLVPNKFTLIEWISTAIAKYEIAIREDQYRLLLHTLTASFSNSVFSIEKTKSYEYQILKKAQEFSINYAGIHNRPKYQDQGIKTTIDKSYFV